MTAIPGCCAHCGKHGTELRRCSRCRLASYCGAECQRAGWKLHKAACAPKLSIKEVVQKLDAAHEADDWRAVLKFEGRVDEMLAIFPDNVRAETLAYFTYAHGRGLNSTGKKEHAVSAIALEEQRIPILVKLKRFRDQGIAMCDCADRFYFLDRNTEAGTSYQAARDVGAAHGFFSLESRACQGLGKLAEQEGRIEEGLDLFRNALAAAPLNETDDSSYELSALDSLIGALFEADALEEVNPTITPGPQTLKTSP